MSKTFRIEIFTHTTKGKTNHIDNVFITSDADKEAVKKHYTAKYQPLSVSVSELETVEVNLEDRPERISIEKTSTSYLNDPEYRIDRNSLPEEVQGYLKDLDTLETSVSNVKTMINKVMFGYFSSGGAMISHAEDAITCRGYIKPFALKLNNKE